MSNVSDWFVIFIVGLPIMIAIFLIMDHRRNR